MNKFWIIIMDGISLTGIPKRHYNKEDAIKEVERLVSKEKARFILLECVGICQPHKEVEWPYAPVPKNEAF